MGDKDGKITNITADFYKDYRNILNETYNSSAGGIGGLLIRTSQNIYWMTFNCIDEVDDINMTVRAINFTDSTFSIKVIKSMDMTDVPVFHLSNGSVVAYGVFTLMKEIEADEPTEETEGGDDEDNCERILGPTESAQIRRKAVGI